jgi:hypothetical protein
MAMKVMHIAATFGTLVSLVEGTSFLHAGEVNQKEAENSLLAELATTFRPGAHSERITILETALKPMISAVPQEADGTLSHAVVRYVLHRFFVKRHGWFIRGLEPGSEPKNVSATALKGVEEWVPSYLQGFLEQLSGGHGLSLREMAVFAATLEDLIHREAIERLKLAYTALGLSQKRILNDVQASELIETYMIIYNLGGNFSVANAKEAETQLDFFASSVKEWNATRVWLSNITSSVRKSLGRTYLDFEATSKIVEEIGEQFATFNVKDCAKLKNELLSVESKKPGRVWLPEFYKKGLISSVFEFNEKEDYLRDLGALDDSSPSQPHVIIPNYVSSRPNCLISSSFYVVCCRNECEDLMGSLEDKISTENAKPKEIIDIVSSLSSESVQAPRQLSATLTKRLQDIADSNGGEVPMHGRLFAQWMHHAFPRECPFPHLTGTINPQTPDEWMRDTNQTNTLSKEEMERHVNTSKVEEAADHKELPWHHDEELLRPNPFSLQKSGEAKPRRWFRDLLVLVILCTMALGMTQAWKALLDKDADTKQAKTKKSRANDDDNHYHLA